MWRGPESLRCRHCSGVRQEMNPDQEVAVGKEGGESRGLSRDTKPRAMALGPLVLTALGPLFSANHEGTRSREMRVYFKRSM